MDVLLVVLSLAAVVMWFWISLLAILCVVLDPDLDKIQRWGQTLVVVLIPFIGASFILKLVNEHSPEVVARFYIPWPFRNMVLDKKLTQNGPGSNGEEVPGSHSAGANSSSFGGDGGGSSD
jgi:hypothetical protein